MKNRFVLLFFLSFSIASSFFIVSGDNNWEITANTSVSDTWHFIALGDNRQPMGYWNDTLARYSHENQSSPLRAAMTNSIVDNNPNLEFILSTGDIVASGGEQDDWNRYYDDIENATQNNVTFYYATGNHEKYTYSLPDGSWGPSEPDFATYRANVDLHGNEFYYSFDYNNQVHFVFINTEDLVQRTLSWLDQKDWLVNDLENNSIDFVVAAFHRPCYSVGGLANRVEEAQSIRLELEPIFLQYDVDLVFTGHDHYYYRTVRNGIAYVTTGGGGAELRIKDDESEWQEGDVYFSEYHYNNVTVTEDSVNVNALIFHDNNKSTTLADSFQIPFYPTETSTTTTTTTSLSKTSTSTNIAFTPIVISLIVIGILRKLRKL